MTRRVTQQAFGWGRLQLGALSVFRTLLGTLRTLIRIVLRWVTGLLRVVVIAILDLGRLNLRIGSFLALVLLLTVVL